MFNETLKDKMKKFNKKYENQRGNRAKIILEEFYIMNLQDTVKMMVSKDYKERFRAEYWQLKLRVKGLNNMLIKYKEETLNFKPSCSYELLAEQFHHMKEYLKILEERAKIEDIEL